MREKKGGREKKSKENNAPAGLDLRAKQVFKFSNTHQ
jgi:hypothetical protein